MISENDTEGYVAYYDVQDEDDDAEPKKLMERCNNRFHQDDATYLLMWQGFYLNIDIDNLFDIPLTNWSVFVDNGAGL